MDTITALIASEVLEVIYNSNLEIYEKIPQRFIELLEKIADDNDQPVVLKANTPIYEQPISDEAKVILAMIYNDYLGGKEKFEEFDKICFIDDDYDIFADDVSDIDTEEKEVIKEETEDENKIVDLVEYKEQKWYEKIIKKILSFFYRKGA